jgi:hypothetical protein
LVRNNPHIAGRHLRLDGVDYTVLGLMPSGFELFNDADFWNFRRRQTRGRPCFTA